MFKIKKGISNAIGWRTPRKIVVFESDDWGSIRIRSKKDYDEMLSKGLEVDRSNFTAYDCLESNSDLENLYDLLHKHKDSNGKSAVITAMCILANPDFEKIRESGFQEYYYENFADTCKRYANHDRVLNLWQQGIDVHLFVPAFHGREHLSVTRWLKALQQGNEGLLIAFEHQSFGATLYKGYQLPEYLGAFHPDYSTDIPDLEKVIETGAELFRSNLGFQPTHFIAPNRESPKVLDKTLYKAGIRYLTLSKLRHYPLGDEKYKWEFNWLGKKNEFGQTVITRNCIFEPSDSIHIDWVDACLKEIENAFKWYKPAVISTHRVNYVGFIDPKNATRGLKKLDLLLSNVMKRWSNVEFMTSSELGDLISSSRKQVSINATTISNKF